MTSYLTSLKMTASLWGGGEYGQIHDFEQLKNQLAYDTQLFGGFMIIYLEKHWKSAFSKMPVKETYRSKFSRNFL